MPTLSVAHIKQPLKRIAVIGGGAAGYFSGIEVANYLKSHGTSTSSTSQHQQYEVVIFESSRTPLSKVLISGGGRCNVMHDPRKGAKIISKGYPRGHRELLGPMSSKFGPDETYQWFTSRGIQLKVEEDGRVFPTTDRAESIIEVLEHQAKLSQVQVMASTQVLGIDVLSNNNAKNKKVNTSMSATNEGSSNHETDLQIDDIANSATTIGNSNSKSNDINIEPKFAVKYRKSKTRTLISPYSHIDKSKASTTVSTHSNTNSNNNSNDSDTSANVNDEDGDHSIYECDRVIFATGSNRAGYTMLEKLGHTISPPLPSLFSFKIKDELLTALSGLPIAEVVIKVVLNKTMKAKCSSILNGAGGNYIATQLEQKGPVMITHQGISGPGVLKLSAYGAAILAALNYQVDIDINWLPAVTGGASVSSGGDGSDGSVQTSEQQLIAHLNYQKLRNPNKLVASWFPPVVLPVVEASDDDDDTDWSSGTSGKNKDDDNNSWSVAKDIIVSKSTDPITSTTATATASNGNIPNTSRSNTAKTANNIVANTGSVSDDDLVSVPGQAGIPRRLWKYILLKSGITEEVQAGLKWGTVSKNQIQTIVNQVLKQRHTVTGRGMYRDEFVTCGGVSLKQVNFDTMESKLIKGLFLCGEVIDIDGITGGYNFQAAWTGGWIAGHNCAKSLIDTNVSDDSSSSGNELTDNSKNAVNKKSSKNKSKQS